LRLAAGGWRLAAGGWRLAAKLCCLFRSCQAFLHFFWGSERLQNGGGTVFDIT
jgi:hypothetical protein